MNLKDLTKDLNTIALIGMCKNAGKTTVLNLLLDEPNLAITSIGLDGETVDNVTKTKKPRIFAKKGTLVATATDLLCQCTTTKQILASTGIPSPLGEIVVFRCVDDGFVQIAGPSIVANFILLKKILYDLGAKKIIIDGALGRKSIASNGVIDGAILSTGASYDKDINKVLKDTAFVIDLYNLPTFNYNVKPSLDLIEDARKGKKILYFDGAITNNIIKTLSTLKHVNKIVVGVKNASKILATNQVLETFFLRGGKIKVKNKIKLLAVTINPYSAYGFSFDKNLFKEKMQQLTTLPVINVMEEDNEF